VRDLSAQSGSGLPGESEHPGSDGPPAMDGPKGELSQLKPNESPVTLVESVQSYLHVHG